MDKVDWDYWYAYDLEAGIWHWQMYPDCQDEAMLVDEEWDSDDTRDFINLLESMREEG